MKDLSWSWNGKLKEFERKHKSKTRKWRVHKKFTTDNKRHTKRSIIGQKEYVHYRIKYGDYCNWKPTT